MWPIDESVSLARIQRNVHWDDITYVAETESIESFFYIAFGVVNVNRASTGHGRIRLGDQKYFMDRIELHISATEKL